MCMFDTFNCQARDLESFAVCCMLDQQNEARKTTSKKYHGLYQKMLLEDNSPGQTHKTVAMSFRRRSASVPWVVSAQPNLEPHPDRGHPSCGGLQRPLIKALPGIIEHIRPSSGPGPHQQHQLSSEMSAGKRCPHWKDFIWQMTSRQIPSDVVFLEKHNAISLSIFHRNEITCLSETFLDLKDIFPLWLNTVWAWQH